MTDGDCPRCGPKWEGEVGGMGCCDLMSATCNGPGCEHGDYGLVCEACEAAGFDVPPHSWMLDGPDAGVAWDGWEMEGPHRCVQWVSRAGCEDFWVLTDDDGRVIASQDGRGAGLRLVGPGLDA